VQQRLGLYALAFIGPLVAALLFTPIAAKLAVRFGFLDLPSEKKHHSQSTPYLGGVAVAGAVAIVGIVAGTQSRQLTVIVIGAAVLGLCGLVDDWKGIGPLVKLTAEAACGLGLWMVGIRAGLFGIYGLDLAVTVFWVVMVTNAMNLVDNMDGLSSGIGVLASGAFFIIAAGRGDYLVASLALAMAGANLGFLRYNFPPASIFLGDAGTLMIGFMLAAVGLQLDLVGNTGYVRAAIPILILSVPLFDMALVVLSRTLDGKPFYVGGTDHSSHRLDRMGFSARRVAMAHYGAEIACCGLAIWLLHAPRSLVLPTVVGVGIGAFILLLMLTSAERRRLSGGRPVDANEAVSAERPL
jgi:UDP-GlcNAc:undecaprenyl-phosphate/decaprenyl-phosphate GlcNAc-1-phosphate transferase